ncbi:MAG: hypothetical protein HZA15_13100 [Nitrospirae bacterium]|nr:hypothetical protein [Nitrospirota bacterium]
MKQRKYRIRSGTQSSPSVLIDTAAGDNPAAKMRSGAMLLIDGDGRGITVLCTKGTSCLTQPSDPEDHILRSGETFVIDKKGLVAITALTNLHLNLLTTPS